MNTLTDYRIRAYLQSKLTAEEFIGVNQAEVAAALGIRKATVCASLQRLSKLGVLAVGPKAGRNLTYKLRRELADWEKPMLADREKPMLRKFKQPPPQPDKWPDWSSLAFGVVLGVVGVFVVGFLLNKFS